MDRASREELAAYVEDALGRMLRFACDQVPAYAGLAGIVGRLKPTEALKAFPFLDKPTLQQGFDRYLPKNLHRFPHWECTTGGTTGNQLRFYLDDASHSREMAFMHRIWARAGYTPRSRKATFRGVPFPDLHEGVYWQENPIYHELQFSPFHMGEATLDAYVARLRAFRPEFLHGYPSALWLLAEYVLRHGIDLGDLSIKAVLLASEAMYPGQREGFEKAFRCRALSWYGHSERLILGGECEKDSAYHQFPDYGVMEIVDADDNVVAEDGQKGELVGTGLLNQSLPLIRYRTGDLARRRHHTCACGRAFDRFDTVEGRWRQEYVVGKSGSKISPSALNMHGRIFDKVIRYQYYQAAPGRMELRVMATDGFSEQDGRAIQQAFADKVGDELEVVLRLVEDIPLTDRGKLRRLIQEIPGMA
ncbi:MAG TPA: phenylacetate--CoA ligase family protein [Candidatus Hydrogenedentes bacterium]|nr:phenylacetate--CoA ligase family protein [Candidatus Hydrogenedentota bacterium]